MSLSHLDRDRAKLMAVTRTGTSLGSPYSVGLWSGSRLEGDLHPRWEQEPHSHGRSQCRSLGFPCPRSPASPYLASATGRLQLHPAQCSLPATSGPSFPLKARSWASRGGSSPVS